MRKKILIIDDDYRNIFALSAILKSRKYNCISASSAAEGLRILEEDEKVGVVLLDMMMPEMDGYEALKYIREKEAIAKIPVIAVTARAMNGDKEQCLESGANGYVSKPVNIDELTSLINQLI
ncbi:MAG: response regulator [Ginsengibacter sp.]